MRHNSLFNDLEFDRFEPGHILFQSSTRHDFCREDDLFALNVLPRIVKVDDAVVIEVFQNIRLAF